MLGRWSGLAAGLVALGSIGAANAGVIDTRDLPGNDAQAPWGFTNTQFYAQSVVPDAPLWNELRVRIDPSGTFSLEDIDYQILITGARADGGGGLGLAPDFDNILFSSGQLSLVGTAGLTEVTVIPNINVDVGVPLFFVLDDFSFPSVGNAAVRSTTFLGAVDQYLPGEFVFFNTSGEASLAEINLLPWTHRGDVNQDLAFLAVFTDSQQIPEPSSLALMVIALGGLGVLMRHKLI